MARQASVLDAMGKHEEALFTLQEAREMLEDGHPEVLKLRTREAAVNRNIGR